MTDYRTVATPVAPQTLAPGQEVSEAKRMPNVRSDVLVPLNQALLTAGIVAFIPFAVGGTLLVFVEGRAVYWKALGLACLCVFALSLAKAWFWRLAWVESTIKRAESVTGLDLNGDGEVEPPHFFSVRGPQTARPVDPVEQERQRLTAFVNYAFEHDTATDTLLARFNRQEIARFRALLMRQDVGCAEWNNARAVNQGWRFVGTREHVLKTIDGLEAIETVNVKR